MPIAASDPYTRLLVPPLPLGPGTCATCRGPAPGAAQRCHSCSRLPAILDAVAPISLSVAGGPLNRELRGYKDDPSEAARDWYTRGLAAVLTRFLDGHERCVAAAAGVDGFALACPVPSSRPGDEAVRGRLRAIVGHLCPPTAPRYARLLAPSGRARPARGWCPGRYRPLRRLRGEAVLLIDDTWTSGASAQAAAHALREAGAGAVALVVIGRHLEADASSPAWSWERCALEGTWASAA